MEDLSSDVDDSESDNEKLADNSEVEQDIENIKGAKILEDIRLRHTYHSDAIEGNTLSLQETKVVLEEGVTITPFFKRCFTL